MHWKKRMMTPPPDEEKVREIITDQGAMAEISTDEMNQMDQKVKPVTMRAWDDLSINEKCDRLGKWIGYIMNETEKKQ